MNESSKKARVLSPIVNHPHYILIGALATQIVGLILFASYQVKVILPEGNNEVLDWIYANQLILEILKYLSGLLFASGILFSKRSGAIRAISFFAILILIHFNQPWFILLLYPLFLNLDGSADDSADSDSPGDIQPADVPFLAILSVILGGFILMTVQLPFPHRISAIQTYCIHSLSTVFLGTGTLISVLFILISCRMIDKTGFSEQKKTALLTTILMAIVFAFFAYYAHKTFSSFVNQFHIKHVPLMVSGLLTSFLFIVLAQVQIPFRRNLQLEFIHANLTSRFFWLKFLVIFFSIREFYFYLINADQNFLTIFLFDIFNVLLPFVIFILLYALFFKLLKGRKIHRSIKVIAVVGLLLSLAPSLTLVKQDWTLGLKSKRPTAAFYKKHSRRILKVFGIDANSEFNHLLTHFKDGIRTASLTKNQESLTDVFGKNPSRELSHQSQWSSKPPHIFLFIFDAVYGKHLSTYGYRRDTSPNLTRFAADAIQFNHFYSTSSATSQGVASLFTGYYMGNFPHTLDQPRGTLCKDLKQKGYQLFLSKMIDTVAFSSEKKDCQNHPRMPYKAQGIAELEQVKSYMDQHPDKPVFVYFHNIGGHEPWKLPPEKLIYGKSRPDIYDALLHQSDMDFGRFIDWMKKQGIYDKSIIVFSADHGIGLGHHMDLAAYSNLYNVNIHVPFIIRIPGLKPAIMKDAYSLVDVRPTIEDILNIKSEDPYHGQSFLNVMTGQKETGERCVYATATYSDRFAMQCSNGDKLYYLRDLDTITYYNTSLDPYEKKPLIQKITMDRFKQIAKPFIKFMAFGQSSYAINP